MLFLKMFIFAMDRRPVTSLQRRLLHTYVETADSLPVHRIGQMLKNVGVLPCLLPTSTKELVDAIITHGNIAFIMLRKFLATTGFYEVSLNLRQEKELFIWIWVCPCGDIIKKGTKRYKNEDDCLKQGYKNKPEYVNVCIESIPHTSSSCIILV